MMTGACPALNSPSGRPYWIVVSTDLSKGQEKVDYVRTDPRIERVLFPESLLKKRVAELAEEIIREHGKDNRLLLLTVLKGAFVFAADLGRELRKAGAKDVQFHFLHAGTYGDGIKQNGETHRKVRLAGVPVDVKGKDVLLVEDILDQGFTLQAVLDALREEAGAGTVRFCVLLEKDLDNPSPEVAEVRRDLTPDYTGFRIPDRWVAGYGLDVNEEFRDLPDVVIVKEEYFR